MVISQTPDSNDFNDLLESFKIFLKNTDTFNDYNFEGSGIKEILRLLAYDAQQRAFQNNFLYNELLLDSASLRPNVMSIASDVGYQPLGRTAARITCNINVRPNSTKPKATIVLSKGVRFYSTTTDGKLLSFSPAQDYTAILDTNGEYTFPEVTLLQGVWNRNSFLVQTQYNIEAYEIPQSNIDLSTLSVFVKQNQNSASYDNFAKFTSAHQLGSEENIYFVRNNRRGKYELEFGDDRVARRLVYGNVVVAEYLVTEGAVGNNIAQVNLATSIDSYFDVTISNLDTLSYGGADEESLQTVRYLAPLNFAASGNAVTANDYIALTKKLYPNADKVYAWGGEVNDPPRYGYTFVSVKPKGADVLTDIQKQEVYDALVPYNVGSITPIIVDPDYLYLNVYSIVKYNPKLTVLSPQAFEVKVQDYLELYSAEKLDNFGIEFDMSKLIEYINSIDRAIKGNKTRVSYEKRFVPELNFSANYTFKIGHSLSPNTVEVSNFTINSIETDVYYLIKDDGNGILQLLKYDLDDNFVVLNPIQGTVDYSNGIIALNGFIPVSIIGDYVKVVADPSGYDESVTAQFNNIITIEASTISLEVSYV